MAHIHVEKAKIGQKQTQLLVIGVFENEQDFVQSKELDPVIYSTIKEIFHNKEFRGTFGSIVVIPTMNKGPMKKIMFIGLGEKEKFTNESARIISGKTALKAKELGIKEISILPFSNVEECLLEAISEGINLSLYSFNKYKTMSNDEVSFSNKPIHITILVNSDVTRFQSVVDRASLIVESVNFAREMGNLPPNECSPAQFVSLASSVADKYSLKMRVIERYEMESIGLNGVVAVGNGSNNPPKMVILEYNGNQEHQKPYLLVGKAVTFDTGGISLKPGDKMDEMKFDKCGGCNVVGIMKAVASLKLPLNVVAVIPSVENMPSSNSYRPGDIIRLYNGKTIEVINTDAEGRIILADALAYGIATYHPKVVIDMATLTGACIIALGANVAAMIGTNKQLTERLGKISARTAEKMWELPLYEEFYEQIKSNVADIKNIGGRPGGAITAAAFLSNFTDGIPWVHLDIAGPAWTQDGTHDRSYNPKGATGFGIRSIIKLLMEDNYISS